MTAKEQALQRTTEDEAFSEFCKAIHRNNPFRICSALEIMRGRVPDEIYDYCLNSFFDKLMNRKNLQYSLSVTPNADEICRKEGEQVR